MTNPWTSLVGFTIPFRKFAKLGLCESDGNANSSYTPLASSTLYPARQMVLRCLCVPASTISREPSASPLKSANCQHPAMRGKAGVWPFF